MSTATPTRTPDNDASSRDTDNTARLRRTLQYGVLGVLTLLFVSPLLYMLSTAFKTTGDAASPDPQWIPDNPTTQAFEAILDNDGTPVVRWLVNSLVAAGLQSLLIVATAALAGYALARMDFAGKKWIFGIIIGTLFIPPVILLIPNYLITSRIGWLDTLAAVIVPGAAGAFGVFFMRQFFLGLPIELEEAAYVDGAGRLRTFLSIALPMAGPALATLAVITFLAFWNDYLWPVIVCQNNCTLPAGLRLLQRQFTGDPGLVMAGAVVAAIPVLILYLALQRYIVQSVASSGIKG